MSALLKIFILLCGVAFTGTVFRLLMKRKISERNSILWLCGSLVILILSAAPEILEVLARAVRVDYPPTLLFLFSSLVLLLIVLSQSMQISVLSEQLKELTQHVAINNFKEKAKNADPVLQKAGNQDMGEAGFMSPEKPKVGEDGG